MPAIYDFAEKYEDKNIRVICTDGDVVSGVFVEFQCFADVDDEPETITIENGFGLIEIPFLEIAYAEVIDDTE